MGNKLGKVFKKQEIKQIYDIKEKLGSGSFAVVKRAIKKADGSVYAVKIIKKDKLARDELNVLHDEVEIMYKIQHPNCVRLYEMYDTKKKLYMVMELLTGGELFDRIVRKGSYSEKEASQCICAVAGAMKYLHSIGVVHRDLKPENLLYDSPKWDATVKITDFGLAKYTVEDSNTLVTACGTPGYVAPEVLKQEKYGSPVDLWSLGVILYILLCGFPPFYDESTPNLYKLIKSGKYKFPAPYWNEISDDAKDLVKKLIQVDPAKRYTADDVLKHPWISGGKASDKEFSDSHTHQLKLLQARRILRNGVQRIIAINRFAAAINEKIDQPMSDT